jgi:hypothetical protein
MQISKPLKILVGIGTLWYLIFPFIYIGLIFIVMFGITGLAANVDESAAPLLMLPFFLIFPLFFLTILVYMALMVFYIIHLVKNKEGSETARILLGLGFFFLTSIAMAVYYFIYVWPDTPPTWALEKQAPVKIPDSPL